MITSTTVSTFFAAVAAIAASLSVYHMMTTRKQELEFGRPYFTITQPGIKQLPQSPPFRVQITMENIGVRPACDLVGRVCIVDTSLKSGPRFARDFSVANEIPAKTPTPWYNDSLVLPPNVPPHYVVFAIKYKDPVLNKFFVQVFFMRWSGVVNGQFYPDFVHVSIREKQKIWEALKNLLKGFM